MKLPLYAVLSAGLLATSVCVASDVVLKTDIDKVSYTVGVDLGKNFKKQDININVDALVQGLKDGQTDAKLAMTKEEMQNTLNSFRKTLMEKHTAKMKLESEKNKKEGDAFLAQNKNLPGVVTTVSGLQYKVITPGNGPKPLATDSVQVEYTGRLINGKEFDSTKKVGKPATFRVSDVISGWTEALKIMPQGSTWEVYIPANLAYGEHGVGEAIGPNQTLIFTIHLLTVEKGNKGSQVNQQKITHLSNKRT